ncbi:hypothetical protein A6A26_17345 [Pantoea sp. OXWO6B1]|nr:hypothetical protein A6A26_17345 [Pantoea sp. OXWO6B1]
MNNKFFYLFSIISSLFLFCLGFNFHYEILTLSSACQDFFSGNISSLFYNKTITGLTLSIFCLLAAFILRKKSARVKKIITQQFIQILTSIIAITVNSKIKPIPCESITTGYPLNIFLAFLFGFIISMIFVLKRREP